MNKKAKIVMITMFKNESRVLKRMLESCKPYVDYYVMQNTMLTDLYHFFYIGKSYSDTYRGTFFPLKESHQKEYARERAKL